MLLFKAWANNRDLPFIDKVLQKFGYVRVSTVAKSMQEIKE
jgi:hypothetical protein